MKAWLGKVVGGESEDLSRHDKWLCMMYPRLVLLREMLREDGSLWMKFLEVKTSLLQLFGKKYLRQKVLLDIYQKTMNSYWFTHKIKIFGHEIYV